MGWKVRLDPHAEKELDDLDPQIARRTLQYLFSRIATGEDPRPFGEPLRRDLTGLWK